MASKDQKLLLLMAVFASLFVMANFLATKQVVVGPLTLTLGLLAFPFMFLVTDTVNEVWGKDAAKDVVRNGFITMIIAVIITQVAVYLPPAPHFAGEGQEAFAMIFGMVPRITAASLVAYLLSQYHDIWAFAFWRRVTDGKHLWLRNNLSTITSQLLDSVAFIGVGFLGTVPMEVFWSMILGQWVVKIMIALAETPFVYVLVGWARK